MLRSLLFMLALFLIILCTLIFTAERLAVVRVHEGGKKKKKQRGRLHFPYFQLDIFLWV